MNADQALAHLRQEFVRRGWARKATARIVVELIAHVLLMIFGSALFFLEAAWGMRMLGILLSALGCVGIASNTHTSSHFATCRGCHINRLLTYFGYAVCLGFSAQFWWANHVKGHHSGPNVIGVDDDFDFLPLFTVDAEVIARSSGFKRIYYTHFQQLMLFAAIPLVGFNLQRRGVYYLLREFSLDRLAIKRIAPDLFGLTLHVVLFVILPSIVFSFTHVVTFYCLRMLVLSAGLFVVLAPGHFPVDVPLVTSARANSMSFAALQTFGTANFRGNWIVRWFSSGLGYQIEHHLFPEVSHPRYSTIAPFVEDYCRTYGLHYRSYSLGQGLRQSLSAFRNPKRVEG